ncbi:esterase-like activity of phytase family protein [Thiolapillus sp.]
MSALKLLLPVFVLTLSAGCTGLLTPSEQGLSCQRIESDIRWGALSGLTADPVHERILYAVHDHNLPRPEILVMNASGNQAVITRSIPVLRNGEEPPYDLEGIARRQAGGFWLASEGKPGRHLPNLIVRTDSAGHVEEEVPLPAAVARYRIKAGFEGIASTGTGEQERVAVVFQRRWKDDPKGQVKIGQYWPARGQWRFYRYVLDKRKGSGLSAASFTPSGDLVVLERDNKPFFKAKIKRLYRLALPSTPDTSGKPYPVLHKTLVGDILQSLDLFCGTDGKLEGLTRSASGYYLIADDDGDGNVPLLWFQP